MNAKPQFIDITLRAIGVRASGKTTMLRRIQSLIDADQGLIVACVMGPGEHDMRIVGEIARVTPKPTRRGSRGGVRKVKA